MTPQTTPEAELREALVSLNQAVDQMWNEGGSTRLDNARVVLEICNAQTRCKEALRLQATAEPRGGELAALLKRARAFDFDTDEPDWGETHRLVRELADALAASPPPLETARGGEIADHLAWLDERALNSRSFGSHADAYEIAARRLRIALGIDQ